MAKPQQPQLAQNDPAVEKLAAELFVKLWTPNPPTTVEHIADKCVEAATTFYRSLRSADNQNTGS